jgi:hypothetical protein
MPGEFWRARSERAPAKTERGNDRYPEGRRRIAAPLAGDCPRVERDRPKVGPSDCLRGTWNGDRKIAPNDSHRSRLKDCPVRVPLETKEWINGWLSLRKLDLFASPGLGVVDSDAEHGKPLLQFLSTCPSAVPGRKLGLKSAIHFERITRSRHCRHRRDHSIPLNAR